MIRHNRHTIERNRMLGAHLLKVVMKTLPHRLPNDPPPFLNNRETRSSWCGHHRSKVTPRPLQIMTRRSNERNILRVARKKRTIKCHDKSIAHSCSPERQVGHLSSSGTPPGVYREGEAHSCSPERQVGHLPSSSTPPGVYREGEAHSCSPERQVGHLPSSGTPPDVYRDGEALL